jgi:hypothetical protein
MAYLIYVVLLEYLYSNKPVLLVVVKAYPGERSLYLEKSKERGAKSP